jgi:hypothetical protein
MHHGSGGYTCSEASEQQSLNKWQLEIDEDVKGQFTGLRKMVYLLRRLIF